MQLISPRRRLGSSSEVGAKRDGAYVAKSTSGHGIGQAAAGRLADDVAISHEQHLRIRVLSILRGEERKVHIGK